MPVTDDDYFVDAINIFKFSNTGKGIAAIPARENSLYINRYKSLVPKVIDTLWRLKSSGQIQFAPITYWGESVPSGPIRVAQFTKTPSFLPVIASILAHEAAHRNTTRDISSNYVSDEIACRTLECLFYQDLVTTGVRINSKVYNTTVSFKLTQANYIGELREQYDHFLKGQLVDFILSEQEYRSALTPEWVDENLNFWGGIKNRWSSTLGYFVRTLAAKPTTSRDVIIQKLMMLASDRGASGWLKMIREATRSSFPAAKIKSALASPFLISRYTDTMKKRISAWGLINQPHNGLDCLP